jgi:uncharacterized protein YkwD
MKKNRMLSLQADSLFAANYFLLNQNELLQASNDSLLNVLKPAVIKEPKKPDEKTKIETNKGSKYPQWEVVKYKKANTAKEVKYLSKEEKEFIRLLNLCRMNPKLFLETYLSDIIKKSAVSRTKYESSLVEYLSNLPAQEVMYPDSLLFLSALCHATNAGKSGYVGHSRTGYKPACGYRYSAECCSYGSLDALGHLINFMVDEGVESLGHRMSLMGDYKFVGVSIQPHKTYTNNIGL